MTQEICSSCLTNLADDVSFVTKYTCWLRQWVDDALLRATSFLVSTNLSRIVSSEDIPYSFPQRIRNLWLIEVNQEGNVVSICKRGKRKKENEVAQLCLTLCDPRDHSPPGSSIHGILQARVLEWVAISFSRGSSLPRDQVQVSRTSGRLSTLWATRETLKLIRRVNSMCSRGKRWEGQKKKEIMNNAKTFYVLLWKGFWIYIWIQIDLICESMQTHWCVHLSWLYYRNTLLSNSLKTYFLAGALTV